MPRNPSQCDLILARLKTKPGVWVPMPELAKAASPTGDGAGIPVHSRMADLRTKRGLTIESKQLRVDGVCHSFYRLIAQEQPTDTEPLPCPQDAPCEAFRPRVELHLPPEAPTRL